MNCEKTQRFLDSYVSNELLVETNHEMLRHLEECSACAAEAEELSRLKERVKAAVQQQAVPPGLEARVRRRLEPRRRLFAWWSAGMLAAAAAAGLFVGIWLGYPRERLPALADRPAQAAFIEKVGAHLEESLQVGLRDHVHCSVFRLYPQNPPPAGQMVRDLGPEYQALLPLFEAAAPPGYRCVMAHHCSYAGRKYVHLTLRKGSDVLSLVIARKNPGESMAGLKASRIVSGIPVYEATAERFRVAAFETETYMAYVISDTTATANLEMAATLAPAITKLLAG
jgi:hypothetical protein